MGDELLVAHVDVDAFYVAVERADDPSLAGVPLAVQQGNSGGFVAVSAEARAAGVRKGDGVGAGGRAGIQALREMGAVSAAEARRRCPGLVVRPSTFVGSRVHTATSVGSGSGFGACRAVCVDVDCLDDPTQQPYIARAWLPCTPSKSVGGPPRRRALHGRRLRGSQACGSGIAYVGISLGWQCCVSAICAGTLPRVRHEVLVHAGCALGQA